MPDQDSYHDYRPDPEYTVESHLAPGTPDPEDAFIPASARKAHGVLQGFHERFVWGEAKSKSEKLTCPTKWSQKMDPKWDELSHEDQVKEIDKLSWKDICDQLKTVLTEQDFGKPYDKAGKPVSGAVNGTQPQYGLRPYFVRMLWLCDRDWKGVVIPKLLKEPDKSGLTLEQGNALMVGMLNFRMTYMWDLICTLKEGGVEKKEDKKLELFAKAVGSADRTSDIDITVSGPGDVHAMVEINRYARQVWGRDLGTLLDTMIYVRDWMLVTDNINRDNKTDKTRKDPSIQVEVIDFLGDLYGLVKVRRFCSKGEWKALVDAIKRDVKVDGLEAGQIPRLARLDQVETIFSTHYVRPLLARLKPIHEAFKEAGGHDPGDEQELLEELEHFDPDGFLRVTNIAYAELAAKVRDWEAAHKKKFEGQGKKYTWRQNDGKPVVDKEVPWDLAGMVEFIEVQSQLVSEMACFATEAYNTQGSLWQVVGGQGGDRPVNLTLEHYLQAFNEQVGDALKELRHHGRAAKHEGGGEALERETRTAYHRASKYEQRMCEVVTSLHAGLQVLRNATILPTGAKNGETGKDIVAMVNPVAATNHKDDHALTELEKDKKWECGTCKTWVKDNLDKLRKEHPVERRRKAWSTLFPGKLGPDDEDMALLGFEVAVAQFYDKHVGKLLDIRKMKGDYAPGKPKGNDQERLKAAKALVEEATSSSSPFTTTCRDPARDPGRVTLENVDPGKAYGNLKWGLDHLKVHLLTHCAVVNKAVRNVFSRGPIDIEVKRLVPAG